jgi:hypothetical protein
MPHGLQNFQIVHVPSQPEALRLMGIGMNPSVIARSMLNSSLIEAPGTASFGLDRSDFLDHIPDQEIAGYCSLNHGLIFILCSSVEFYMFILT